MELLVPLMMRMKGEGELVETEFEPLLLHAKLNRVQVGHVQ